MTPILSVSILLWNVWLLPSFIYINQGSFRAKQLSLLLNDYDIVVLNEAFYYKREILELVSHSYSFYPPRSCFSFIDSGLLVLSKYRIENTTFRHFSSSASWDRFASKGIVGLTVDINGLKLDLYGTHLQAGAAPSHQAARMNNIRDIESHIENTSSGTNPLILVGDMNCGPVLDPTFNSYSSHYTSRSDAIHRHLQYTSLRDSLFLTEMTPPSRYVEDINRGLYRNGENAYVAAYKVTYPRLLGPFRNPLSDTRPVLYRVSLSPVGTQ